MRAAALGGELDLLATFLEPRLPPIGIRWVIVNGQIAAVDGELAKVRAGKVLRR